MSTQGVNVFNNVYSVFLKGIKCLIAFLAAVLVVVVFSNVICRYFLSFSLAWAEEVARFLFIWLSCLGAVLANAYSAHMNFNLVIEKMPKKTGLVFTIISYIVILINLFLVTRGGIKVVMSNLEWLSPALEIPFGLVYTIFPVCTIALAVQFFARMLSAIKSLLGFSQAQ